MCEREFEEQKPTNSLRRSPRFLHRNQIVIQNPRTRKPATRKTRVLDSFSSSRGSSVTKPRKNGNGISQKGGKKGNTRSKSLTELSKGSRRSARFDIGPNLSSLDFHKQCVTEKRATRVLVCGIRCLNSQASEWGEIQRKGCRRSARLENGANMSKNEEDLDSQKQYVIEKRVTRSSVRLSKYVNNEDSESVSEEEFGEKTRVLSKDESIGKRVTRSSSRPKIKASNVPIECPRKAVFSDERKSKGDTELSKPYVSKRDAKDCGVNTGTGDEHCTRKMQIGEKRKRCQIEDECEIVQGWTKEQELALRRAYFTAKPTPHFWKKVAKMVPGKSAEECFDRIQSDHLTPTQPRTRSRANRKNPSPLSFSASKLLSPPENKTKRSTRRKTLLAQKTVRHLLQKQQKEDQDYEADLFAVLEPTMDPSSINFQEGSPFMSPAPKQGSGILTRCREMSSSAHKKHLTRLQSSSKAAFVSPPVLKQVKNKALHEKYIDQLHCRDAKRKAQSLRTAKYMQDQSDTKASLLNVNPVKVAKDALVFEAQDAINQFRCLQSAANDNIDDEDTASHSNDDEDEDEDEDEI